MKRILIVEDEKDILKTLEFNLKSEGFNITTADDGKQALEKLQNYKPELIILDVMLPYIDGFSVLRSIKSDEKTKKIPVIMLTARDSEIDKITGLDAGADDYLPKPFSIRELIARINAVLRRYETNEKEQEEITIDELKINLETFEVKIKNEKIDLTAKEFMLLKEFILSKGKVLTKEELFNKVWDMPSDVNTRTLDVHIMNLRKKLKSFGKKIITIKNIGYKIEI